jgi:uncharacterized protein
MNLLTAFIAGLIFGMGLILSGMANPEKIIDFLDITGQWDPSLMFVMAGALIVSFFAFRYVKNRNQTCLKQAIQLPTSTQIDRRLVVGSILFGAGWGMAGYCPGPALTSLLTWQLEPFIFVLTMLAGMGIYTWIAGKH